MYDANVDQIDWTSPTPWATLLRALNGSQRAVVAVAQVHEHAAFNGLQATVQFHGPEIIRHAIDGAGALGQPRMQEMLVAALEPAPDWESLEDQRDRDAEFEIGPFIEAHADDFFVDD